jgi:hypothetical protein
MGKSMLSRSRLRWLKFGLVVWLLVVATAPAFSHDHPEGDKPHAHGLGIFSTTSIFGSGYNSNNAVSPETRHSHLVIFGIEIHIPASCPWAADQDSPLPAEESYFQLGAEIVKGLQAQATESGSQAAVLQAPDMGVPVRVDVSPNEETFPPNRALLPAAASLCDLARGLRSGAQQV